MRRSKANRDNTTQTVLHTYIKLPQQQFSKTLNQYFYMIPIKYCSVYKHIQWLELNYAVIIKIKREREWTKRIKVNIDNSIRFFLTTINHIMRKSNFRGILTTKKLKLEKASEILSYFKFFFPWMKSINLYLQRKCSLFRENVTMYIYIYISQVYEKSSIHILGFVYSSSRSSRLWRYNQLARGQAG